MKYSIDYNQIKNDLNNAAVDEKLIESVLKIIQKLCDECINMPIFNGLRYIEVKEGKNIPLTIMFASTVNGLKDEISLVYEDDALVLRDTAGYYVFTFKEDERDLRFTYGNNIIHFNQNSHDGYTCSSVDYKCNYSKGKIDVYRECSNLYVSDLIPDFSVDICSDSNYTEVEFSRYCDSDGEIKSAELNRLDSCILLAIDYCDHCYRKYIEPFEKMTKRQ
jgi:hypothetical protein